MVMILIITIIYSFCHQNDVHPFEDVPLVEFMYLVFTRMPSESYRRQLRSLLLYLCYVFGALINSLVLILHERSGPRSVSDLFQILTDKANS